MPVIGLESTTIESSRSHRAGRPISTWLFVKDKASTYNNKVRSPSNSCRESGPGRAQVGPKIGTCAFSTLAASREWLQTDTAQTFIRAYRKTREYLNTASAEQITTDVKSFFPEINTEALCDCIAVYQALGCWTAEVAISPEAYEVTLDVFEHAGVLSERYAMIKSAVRCLCIDSSPGKPKSLRGR